MEQHHEAQYARAIEIIEALPANQDSDVILVPGSAHGYSDIAEVTAERFRACERAIVISGHRDESRAIRELVVALGVPSSRIECEQEAGNTLENFLFSKPFLHKVSPRQSIEIICKDYAAPRVLLTATRTLPEWKVGLHPYRLNSVTPAVFLDKFVAETAKIEKYAGKGDISTPETIGLDPGIFIDQI